MLRLETVLRVVITERARNILANSATSRRVICLTGMHSGAYEIDELKSTKAQQRRPGAAVLAPSSERDASKLGDFYDAFD